MDRFSEDDLEQMAVEVLGELGWDPVPGTAIAPGAPGPDGEGERHTWDELLIRPRLRAALRRLNPEVPRNYLDQALDAIGSATSQDAITENQRIHDILVNGYRGISYVDAGGTEQNPTIRLVGGDPHHNDWVAARQVTITRGEATRRFDVVLYLNGMPVGIIELKRAGDAQADTAAAHAQLSTYLREFPLAFRFAVVTVISDGVTAKYGTPFTPLNHYSPWNVGDDGRPLGQGAPSAPSNDPEPIALERVLYGVFPTHRFLEFLTNYVAFDETEEGLIKRIAKPHQYFAVDRAVAKTIEAVDSHGKAGVVWHTQGSGKSMEMELYANQVLRVPKLRNPTIVVITDRTELDGQLYETFNRSTLLPEKPVPVRRREQLRTELADRITGGIYFTTLQKFGLSKAERESGAEHPLLSDRRNIIVIVDEAHRSHYDNLDGYAWHLKNALPRATLIAFTGTPVSFSDRNTREVFGDYIDIYDLTRAVEDGATVPVHFESRLIKVDQAEELSAEDIDRAADEATEGLDDTERQRIEKTVAVINALYGAPARIKTLAEDLVQHWEARREAMFEAMGTTESPATPGKAMIVCATRQICADLYAAITALRPEWHTDSESTGRIKVVYSGDATDQPPISNHVRRDSQNKTIKNRLREADDELELVIVKDMMLTGFDAPPLHTLYLDRPLKGALLMQTLARVNRTYRGKQDGLLVAYAPVADNLARALEEYTDTDRQERPQGRDISESVDLTRQLIDSIAGLLQGVNWRERLARPGPRAYIDAVNAAMEYLRSPLTPGNKVGEDEESLGSRFRRLSSQLGRAWAIGGRDASLADVAGDARFFEEVRIWMAKRDAQDREANGEPVPDEVQRMLNKLVATAVVSEEVIDVYGEVGIDKPALSELDTSFITAMKQAPNPHLAIEALRNMLLEESRAVLGNNVVRQRAFSEQLQDLMTKYINQNLTSAEIIAALIEEAKAIAAEPHRGEQFSPPLSDDELAFYDAVAQNESAVTELGQDVLAKIARSLVQVMRKDVRTDWTVREDVRAKLRSSVKRLLAIHGYPPDRQPAATKLVMEQMQSLAPEYALSVEV